MQWARIVPEFRSTLFLVGSTLVHDPPPYILRRPSRALRNARSAGDIGRVPGTGQLFAQPFAATGFIVQSFHRETGEGFALPRSGGSKWHGTMLVAGRTMPRQPGNRLRAVRSGWCRRVHHLGVVGRQWRPPLVTRHTGLRIEGHERRPPRSPAVSGRPWISSPGVTIRVIRGPAASGEATPAVASPLSLTSAIWRKPAG